MPAPHLALVIGLLLGAAVLVASVRLVLHARSGRVTGARAAGLIALQCLAAALLHAVLFPPASAREAGLMTVLTAGASRDAGAGLVVALPEYAGRAVEPAPDLATALRRHPGVRRVEVRGDGLPWRDHDAARDVAVSFDPVPLADGLVELHVDTGAGVGQRSLLRGRITGTADGRVELRDPVGSVQASTALDGDGRFALPLLARAAGPVEFELHLLDAAGQTRQRVGIPFAARAEPAPRMLVLAGAPGAELRALRRWAVDAGVELKSRVRISRDVSLGAAPGVEADELDGLDLVMLDLRSWRTLDEAARTGLLEAVEAGLGVLLRLDEALRDEDVESLRMLGFHARNSDAEAAPATLHQRHLGGADRDEPDTSIPALARRPVAVDTTDAAVLLEDEAGEPLALWRNVARGRIGLWWLDETYPLALQAEPGVHATLWSTTLATLARARQGPDIDLGVDAGAQHRRVLCGLDAAARIRPPEGPAVALHVDARGCAGFWPTQPGWHALESAGARRDFHVAADGLRAASTLREANRRLASRPQAAGASNASEQPVPGSPWPWWLAFLAAVTALWWLERRRPTDPVPRGRSIS